MNMSDEQEGKQTVSKRRAVRGGSYQSAGVTKEVYRRNAIPCCKLSTASTECNLPAKARRLHLPGYPGRVAHPKCIEPNARRKQCLVRANRYWVTISNAAVGSIQVTGRPDSGRTRRRFPDRDSLGQGSGTRTAAWTDTATLVCRAKHF